MTKHQSRLPCAFLVFFSLSSDPTTSSLQDNKLKSEINNVRNILSSTNYKTRLVVVLLGDGAISPSELEDRFNTVRRATALDGKSIFFLPNNSSRVEVAEFVSSLLSSLQAPSVEYYRDLSKHCRRKRNRNVVPQPTIPPGMSHTLSLQGWTIRYEFKLGVLAEFRQEMDAACRNYETAYENLFGPEIIDAIAVWSPRFNEARLLADMIAFRIIRCLLWTDKATTAVKSWITHRDRVRDLVNRRGKGTSNYAWDAWQTVWTKIMADLLSRSTYPLLNVILPEPLNVLPIFVGAEQNISTGDRATPWEQVHHEGYWLNIASQYTIARRTRALQVPEEDRQSPSRSPASTVASKAHLYDTYLALEPYLEVPSDGTPGYNYGEEIIFTLDAAIQHFAKRGQLRRIEILRLQKAREQIHAGAWAAAIDTIRSLWTSRSWRRAGWWNMLQQLGWALLDCLSQVRNPDLLIQLLWELSTVVFERKAGIEYDLHLALQDYDVDDITSAAVDMDEALSPIVPSFAFSTHDVFVGEPLECQLSLQSRAQSWMPPIRLSEVKVVFEGGLKPIYLVAEEGQESGPTSSTTEFVDVLLEEAPAFTNKRSSAGAIASQTGVAKLSIPPNCTKIFRLVVVPREAGEVSIASITLLINDDKFSLAVISSDFEHSTAHWWETKKGVPTSRPLGQESNSFNSITVQPKPPKLQIEAPGLRKSYYTNESIKIEFDILNDEDEEAVVSIEARMISPVGGAARVKWLDSTVSGEALSGDGGVQTLSSRGLGAIQSSGKSTVSLCLEDTIAAIDHEIELLATYRLVSEPETTLTKGLTVDVGIIRPFEANYDFLPRLDAAPWPSFFESPPPDTDASTPLGLRYLYSVAANLYSFATEPVLIEAILLTATKIVGGAVCSSSTGIVRKRAGPKASADQAAISSVLLPDQTETFDFEFSVQKLVLGDRHTVGVDLALEIGWRRQGVEEVNTTVLEVPRLVATMAEPRVILTTSPTLLGAADVAAYRLNFMIENPSMHFLTFNVSMDASEDYAFSGSKACSLNLAPMSRQSLTYRILPSKKDEWIGVHLNVVDAYFGQTLGVLPGGDGVKADKKGSIFVKV